MKQFYILFFTLALVAGATAQENFNFELLPIPETTGYWNGSDLSGEFGDAQVTFENSYNTDYQSWFGFSYAFDTITVDMQYIDHATDASGNVFGIGYVPNDWEGGTYENLPITCSFAQSTSVQSIDVTNSEYAADVILYGSSFGEPAFTAGDWFKLIISGYSNNELTGEIEFLLADYTDGNSIVINSWETINLSELGTVDSLQFNLASTHTGNYGMNTPAYFCIDNISYETSADIYTQTEETFKIFPNPVINDFKISGINNHTQIIIRDISGKTVKQISVSKNENIDISNLPTGIYFVTNSYQTKKIVKK
ncbi:MAG: DUF4465 domain-containing protein [Bacteroidota bacterium]|nr:DUF4465 domain-containing protein [Bacteroidota bacterium]